MDLFLVFFEIFFMYPDYFIDVIFQCEYEVLVTISLNNGDKFDLIVPISVIVAEKNRQASYLFLFREISK